MPATLNAFYFLANLFSIVKIVAGCVRVAEIAESPPTQSYLCVRGDYTLFRDNCYKAYSGCRTQPMAEAQCVADGGHLASIHSMDENRFVVDLADALGQGSCPLNVIADSIWIGLENIGVLGSPATAKFVNIDGSAFDYANFQTGQPLYDGNCINAFTQFSEAGIPAEPPYEWNDIPCTVLFFYAVCKQPAILVTG